MNIVATLARNTGARLVPKVGLLKVDIFKTAADNTFLGTFVLPHKYQLEVVQCDKTFHQTSMIVELPDDVKFWLGVLEDRANQNQLDFEAHDHTGEFARLVV